MEERVGDISDPRSISVRQTKTQSYFSLAFLSAGFLNKKY